MLAIADVNARTAALQTGRVDAINRCELKTLHLLSRLPGIQILQTHGTKHYSLPMHTDVAPFDQPDVRLALKYAIDRDALLRTVLRGYGSLGNDHPISRGQPYFAARLAQRAYDPDRARFHLRRAGLDGLHLRLSTSDAAFPGAVDTAVLYREHAARAGIALQTCPRAGRRILEKRVAHKALLPVFVERPADRGSDVCDRLCRGRGLERHAFSPPALQPPAESRPGRTRRAQTRRAVRRDADDPAG